MLTYRITAHTDRSNRSDSVEQVEEDALETMLEHEISTIGEDLLQSHQDEDHRRIKRQIERK